MRKLSYILVLVLALMIEGCTGKEKIPTSKSASEILGNPDYLAMSYGGYRQKTREDVPGVEDIKEDMLILHAMGVRIIRTYNSQQFEQAANILKAIEELQSENEDFEMYVMLGAWIDCKGAWTDNPDHSMEDINNNSLEVGAAVEMANNYPDIIKVIAVGNEAMVNWAASYFVEPGVILKWVFYLQDLKDEGKLPADLWITSSDNFESWGGGNKSYHCDDLAQLIESVDFISMHSYPFHDSHYNPAFWIGPAEEEALSDLEKIDRLMLRAKARAISQFEGVQAYIDSLDIKKPIHIGETGWASIDSSFYGAEGSNAADEYKQFLFHKHMREWTEEAGMSCFYFEAFDEQWKDSKNSAGSENHFGMINLKGEAKYLLWETVDAEKFEGLKRGGVPISKTFNGDVDNMMSSVKVPARAN